jgi:hypothetical protein
MQDSHNNKNFLAELELKLSILSESKDSIYSVTNLILKKLSTEDSELAEQVCDIWVKVAEDSSKQPLPLVYVCHEVLTNAAKAGSGAT